MIDRADLVVAARTLVGVPYVHHGRNPVVGVDCAGVVVWALEECGRPMPVNWTYPTQPSLDCAEAWVEMFAHRIDEPESGDVVVEDFRGFGHVSLATGNGQCITAFPGRTVREGPLRRPHSCWRIRGTA